jgi:hypothetical protein
MRSCYCLCVCVCLCIPFIVGRQRLSKNAPIADRQRLGKSHLIVGRQRLGISPLIVARQRLGNNPLIVPFFKKSRLMRSRCCLYVCVCLFIPLALLRNGSVETLPR